MLVTRTLGGVATTLPPEVTFLEIRSVDNKVGAVVFSSPGGVVRVTKPGDPDFDTYVRHHRLQPAKLILLPDSL